MASEKISNMVELLTPNTVTWFTVIDLDEVDPALQNKKIKAENILASAHIQNTDQYLDFGGGNQVSAADLAELLTAGGGAVPFTFVYNASVVPTGIATGEIRLDSHTPSLVSHIFMYKTDKARDVSAVIETLEVNSYIYFQGRGSQTMSGLYKITAVTDSTTYMDYTVAVQNAHAGDISTRDGDNVSIVFHAKLVGAGAASWGTISGTLSDQADLQAALDALTSAIASNDTAIAGIETITTGRALYNSTTTGTVVLDCDSFDSWCRILTGNTDFTFTNTPAGGSTFVRTLEIITTAGESLTFSTANKVIGTFVNDNTTVNLITINFANYPTLGLRVTVVIST